MAAFVWPRTECSYWRLGALASLLTAVCLGGTAACGRRPAKAVLSTPAAQYAAALKQARSEGIPTTPEQFQAPLPPPGRNAALVYNQLIELKKRKPITGKDGILENVSTTRRMPAERQYALIGAAVKRRSDMFKLLHQATALPDCIVVKDWANPMEATFPEYAIMRDCARLLAAQSMLEAHSGQGLAAVKTAAEGFQLADHAVQVPLLIGQLVAIAIDSITLNSLQRILMICGDQPGIAEAVTSAIDQNWRKPRLSAVLRTEAGSLILALEKIRRDGPSAAQGLVAQTGLTAAQISPQDWDALIDASGALIIERYLKLSAISNEPYPRALADIAKLDQETAANESKDAPHWILSIFDLEAKGELMAKQAIITDQASVTRAAAAALLYHRKYHRWPERLEQAAIHLDLDPIDDKPLRYRKKGSGFVVYSAGLDGKFTGGQPRKLKKGADIVFQYPIPSYYKRSIEETYKPK